MDLQKMGSFLKELRKNRGLTQEQLAEKMYVSNHTVSRWETGSNMPDIQILIKLAEFYDVELIEILNGERKSETMNEEVKYFDDHGGFHGDGMTLITLDFSDNPLEEKILKDGRWKELPVDETV